MKNIVAILFLMLCSRAYSQNSITSLFGYKLGQERNEIKKKLGEPFKKGKFDDGYEYEVFLVNPDTSLYIVFEYNIKNLNKVWSIQISGKDYKKDVGIKSTKLGIDKDQVEKLFGKPDNVENIGKYGTKWTYKTSNLSLEVNLDGLLSSIKILGE